MHYPSGAVRILAVNGLVALAYLLSIWVSLWLRYAGEYLTFMWPAAGVALAAVLLHGPRVTPGIFIGAVTGFMLLVPAGPLLAAGLGIAVIVEPLIGRLIMMRLGFRPSFRRQIDAMLLVLVGAMLATCVSPVLGLIVLYAMDIWSPDNLMAFVIWWVSNALGVLIITPFILVWNRDGFSLRSRASLLEALAITTAMLIAAIAVFTNVINIGGQYPVGFLMFPLVIFAGLRFGARGATAATNLVAFSLVAGTAFQQGPYAFDGADSIYLVWLYCAVLGLTTVVAITLWEEGHAATTALRASEEKYRHLVENLNDVLFNISLEGEFTYVSPVIERLSGFRPSEVEGRSFAEFIHPDDLPRLLESMARTLEGHVEPFAFRTFAKDGSLRYATSSSRLLYENGAPIGLTGVLSDCTAEYLAKELQRRSEAQFAAAVESVPFGFWMCDPGGRLIFNNRQFADMWGDQTGHLPAETGLPEDIVGRWERGIARALQGEFVSENHTVSHNGHDYHLHSILSPVIDNGEVIGAIGADIDLTQQRQAEDAMRRAERERQVILDTVPAFIWFKDTENNIVRINHFAALALGLPVTEIEGSSIEQFFPEESARLYETDLQVIRNGQALLGLTERLQFPDGRTRWLQMNKIPHVGADAQIDGIMVFALDVTERVEAEQRLSESEQRLETALSGAGVGMWDVNLETAESFVDERFAAMLGGVPEDFRNWATHWPQTVHPDDLPRVNESIAATTRGDTDFFRNEHRLLARDGTYKWVLAQGRVWERHQDGRPRRIVGTHLDLTERKEAEEARLALESQIQQAQKLESLGVLAGGIAHDFNNLLVGILGNADLALLEMSQEAPGRSYLQSIVKASQRAADLCKQMLAYSGRGRFIIEAVNLNQLVQEMAHLLEVGISKNALLKFRLSDTVRAIDADATQIRQVVMNLITNASEAIGEKSGVVTLRTDMTHCDEQYLRQTSLSNALKPGLYCVLEVSDTGCGMDEQTVARIFEPFFTTKFTGRGLGMAAVLGIVRGHHGAIKIYSEPGRGSTFKLLFPASESTLVVEDPPALNLDCFGGEGLVLVVDDEPGVRAIAMHILERLGFEVITAADGAEGIQQFQDHADRICAVLLDMTMPRVNGEEAFRAMRHIREDVRVILTSGYNESEAMQHFHGKGLAGFVQKPFRAAELADAFQKILTQPR